MPQTVFVVAQSVPVVAERTQPAAAASPQVAARRNQFAAAYVSALALQYAPWLLLLQQMLASKIDSDSLSSP